MTEMTGKTFFVISK